MDTQTRHALKQDSFVQATASSLSWIDEHRSTVIKASIIVVALIAVILAGVIFYNNRSSQAEVLFGKAMDIYNTPLTQPGQPAEPGIKTYATAADRAKEAHPLFEEVADKYSWFKAGANARYLAGMTALDMGQSSAGENDLKQAADGHDSGVAALARLALANLYHQTGRDPQAIEQYQQLIAKPTLTVPAVLAKLQLAGLYEATKPDEARKLYAEIKDQDKTGAAGQIATQKLQGATAQPAR
ncbi:MAG TPA: tetratricopeptide repeat protein [Alloacidobacterium sp.]|nr:tetratricopeptide repeat protein [Alloacidobacterium sp.]